MSDSKPTKPKPPAALKATELARLLEGTDSLRKTALSMDDILGTAAVRAIKDITAGDSLMSQIENATRLHKQFEDGAAAKMLKAISMPESVLGKQINEAIGLKYQFETTAVGKMMRDLAANDKAMVGFGTLKRELWESAAVKGLPDWAGAAPAKLALQDYDLTRYASFMGEASKFQDTLKAMDFMDGSITARLYGQQAGSRSFDQLTKSLANTVDPFADTLKAARLWEISLSSRLASIDTAWLRPQDLGASMLGFARIARLSDAVHVARPFSPEVAELVMDELGRGADPAEDATPSQRDSAAIVAGLKSDLIAFPEQTYGQVVFAAGFHFRIGPTPVPVALEAPDAGAEYNPHYNAVLHDLEVRLRLFVADKLSAIEGSPWVRRRVSEDVRKRWSARQQEERDKRRPVYDLIHYADFMDLADVIGQTNNWKQAFEPTFGNKDDLQVSLRRLHPVRLAIGHSRPLGRSDVLTLVSEATRILRALGVNLLQ